MPSTFSIAIVHSVIRAWLTFPLNSIGNSFENLVTVLRFLSVGYSRWVTVR